MNDNEPLWQVGGDLKALSVNIPKNPTG